MNLTNDFKVTVTCRHEDFNSVVRDNIKEQILRLSKFHAHIIDANVILDKQNSMYKVEILLNIPGSKIIASSEDYVLDKSLDMALEKIKTQIKKIRSKITEHRPPNLEIKEEIA